MIPVHGQCVVCLKEGQGDGRGFDSEVEEEELQPQIKKLLPHFNLSLDHRGTAD